MSELIQFLLARFDEDQAAASACVVKVNPSQGEWTFGEMQVRDDLGHLVVKHTWPNEGKHIARHDPARVLADVESKRRIIDLHGAGPHECVDWDGVLGVTCTCYEVDCPTLRLFALPYAGHPDYDESWKI